MGQNTSWLFVSEPALCQMQVKGLGCDNTGETVRTDKTNR
jgi:hypothetical protein